MKVLIVVDMQRDFIDGALGTPEAVAIVGNVVKRVKDSEGELILFTKDMHHEDYLNTAEGKKLPVPHCIYGTDGWHFHDDVIGAWRRNTSTIRLDDFHENTFGKPVFGSTALVDFLVSRADDIEAIEMLGLCTDTCVISNAIMIKNALPDIPISVLAEGCAGVTPESHTQALNIMKMCHIDII